MLFRRQLQIATLANDSVTEGDDLAYIIPYGLTGFFVLSSFYICAQYGYWAICKYGFGREDPIDAKELLDTLTDEEKKEVITAVVRNFAMQTSSETATDDVNPDDSENDVPLPGQGQEDDLEMQVNKKRSSTPPDESNTITQESSTLESKGTLASSQGDNELDLEVGETTIVTILSDVIPKNKDDDENDQPQDMTPKESPLLFKFDEDLTSLGEEEDENVCPICLGPYEDCDRVFQSKNCSHKFHVDCILEWINSKDQNDCPVCRAQMITLEEMVPEALKLVDKKKAAKRASRNQ